MGGCLIAVKRPHKRWFLPETPDVLGMLVEQGTLSVGALEAFERWARGDAQAATAVRAGEHAADAAKLRLTAAVREAFTTPLEPEDLFELSRGLDEVVNGAKNAVREAEALALTPDEPMADMASLLRTGVQHLTEAFQHLASDRDLARSCAAAAVKDQRRLERAYRGAMALLVAGEDLHAMLATQELYRRLSSMSEEVMHVADRIGYAIVKEA